MVLFTFQMIAIGALGMAKNGVGYFSDNWIILPFFFIYLLLDIWILTASFFPVIKVNNEGVFAYSLFWKRKLEWQEIKSAGLLKSKTLGTKSSFGRAAVSFEFTKEPENKSFFANKGVIVKTFIVVSKRGLANPSSLSLGGQLLTHAKITTVNEIAFEYESKAWQLIQEKLDTK